MEALVGIVKTSAEVDALEAVEVILAFVPLYGHIKATTETYGNQNCLS